MGVEKEPERLTNGEETDFWVRLQNINMEYYWRSLPLDTGLHNGVLRSCSACLILKVSITSKFKLCSDCRACRRQRAAVKEEGGRKKVVRKNVVAKKEQGVKKEEDKKAVIDLTHSLVCFQHKISIYFQANQIICRHRTPARNTRPPTSYLKR